MRRMTHCAAVLLLTISRHIFCSDEVQWKETWYPSTLKTKKDGRYFIHYEGWDDRWNEWVSADRIRPAQPRADIRILSGHSQFVTACAYFPDGRRVLSGSYDQSLRIWDAESGREIRSLNYHPGAVDCAVLSPDGQRILSASRDGTVFIAHLSRPMKERSLTTRLSQARTDLQKNPADAGALATLGEWYDLNGQPAWAAEALTQAREHGATVSLTAQSHAFWLAGKDTEAIAAFEAALDQAAKVAPADEAGKKKQSLETLYLRLCLRKLKGTR